MTIISSENRVWVRISNSCISSCIFCLDSDNLKQKSFVEDKIIKYELEKSYKKWYKNKAIISGWEASINPKFIDYIKYARDVWYTKIQTITNWYKFWSESFTKKCIDNWLDEITFSLHWHTPELHDSLTWLKWAFKNIIKAIYYIRNNHPETIINCDIIICKPNVGYAYKIVQLLKRLQVFEYDILQIVPQALAWENRGDLLFDDIYNHKESLHKLWKESEDKRVHMRANRVFPWLLEWFEDMIQSPEKMSDEVLNEAKKEWERVFKKRKLPECRDEIRCANCYMNWFCDNLNEFYFSSNKKNKKEKLFSHRSIDKINEIYPADIVNFKWEVFGRDVLNLPYCLSWKNNSFTNFNDYLLEHKIQANIVNFTNWFMDEWFRIKSTWCKECKLYNSCKWIHINFIKKYWFKILNPIK